MVTVGQQTALVESGMWDKLCGRYDLFKILLRSAHVNQNGNSTEKVWLEIRSNEQQKQPQNQQQLIINEATTKDGNGINIDARVPVNV